MDETPRIQQWKLLPTLESLCRELNTTYKGMVDLFDFKDVIESEPEPLEPKDILLTSTPFYIIVRREERGYLPLTTEVSTIIAAVEKEPLEEDEGWILQAYIKPRQPSEDQATIRRWLDAYATSKGIAMRYLTG